MQVEQHPNGAHASHGNNEMEMLTKTGPPSSSSLSMSVIELPEVVKERARAICAEFELSHKEMAPNIALKRKQFKQRLQERLWSAACWRDYQLASVQKAFEAEIELIEREFETEKTNLKEKLLNELLEQKKRLLEGRDTADEDGTSGSQTGPNSKAQRKLRAKRTGEGVGDASRAGISTSKRRQQQTGIDALGISTNLGENEVHDDLVLILRDEYGNGTGIARRTRNAVAPGNKSQLQTSVEGPGEEELDITVDNDTLKIADKGEFARGDSVIIQTPDSSELVGTISNIGSREIWIKIDDGAKLKITLSQLQSGRYTISSAEDLSDSTSSSS